MGTFHDDPPLVGVHVSPCGQCLDLDAAEYSLDRLGGIVAPGEKKEGETG